MKEYSSQVKTVQTIGLDLGDRSRTVSMWC